MAIHLVFMPGKSHAQDSMDRNPMEPGRLQSMGTQRVGHNLATEQQQMGKVTYRMSWLGQVMLLARDGVWA